MRGASRCIQTAAEVIANVAVARDLYRMELAVPPGWGPAEPGQFVALTLAAPWRDDERGDAGPALLRRPFCVAGSGGSAAQPVITLLYAAVGKITARMTALKPGSAVDLLGPTGTVFPIPPTGDIVLLGGGRGIAPLLFLAQVLMEQGRAFQLLYGTRTAAEQMPLGALASRTLLSTDDGSAGRAGSVLDLLADLADLTDPILMACGPHAMLAAVAARAARDDLTCYVSIEALFGCGVGICGGCAVPARGSDDAYDRYLWACRAGPVVRAEQIDWAAWGPAHA